MHSLNRHVLPEDVLFGRMPPSSHIYVFEGGADASLKPWVLPNVVAFMMGYTEREEVAVE